MSEKLQAVLDANDNVRELNLHIMLKNDLSRESAAAFAEDLSKLATDEKAVEVLSGSGIILLSATADTVQKIADRPEVLWIDIDSSAPLENLLDARAEKSG